MTELTEQEFPERNETVVYAAGERRTAVLDVIRSAQEELAISLFRCDDFAILDALADAVSRQVKVRALVTPTAKNWDRRLRELETTLESMGAAVTRYSGPLTKYHAKYIVADRHTALVASLNFTRKCFDQTGDFVVTTRDREVVSSIRHLFDHDGGLTTGLPRHLSPRLIIGPEQSPRLLEIFRSAQTTIRIVDHRLNDTAVLAVLREQQELGISVEVLGEGALPGMISHGRLFLVDGTTAVIGSFALTAASLQERREIALQLTNPHEVEQLRSWFDRCARLRPAGTLKLAEFAAVELSDDD